MGTSLPETGPYRIGELVDITIKGARVRHVSADGILTIWDDEDRCFSMPAQAAIERVAPAEWPPKRGDLWADRKGGRWFAVDLGGIDMHSDSGSRVSPDLLLAQGAPLTLIHRDEVPF